MKIFLAADHAGYELKNALREHLAHRGYEVEDLGPATLDKDDDYPQYAFKTATEVLGSTDEDPRGILICGSGQGMSIAANRVAGIRAALAWSPETAAASKRDDNSNILALPSRYIDQETAIATVDEWLKAKFSGDPKYQRRLDEIQRLYG